MATVKLEFDKLEILARKERWKFYFVIVAEHPTENDKMLITSFPEQFIKLKPRQKNEYSFVPETSSGGADGLLVLQRELPIDKHMKVRVYLRHSRQSTRNAGSFLQKFKGDLGDKSLNITQKILGATSPWLVIAKEAVPMIGSVLTKIKDRDFGFVSLDEGFGEEFEDGKKMDREMSFSTGDAKLYWSWSINA